MSLIWSPRDPESVYKGKEELPLFEASGLSSSASWAAQCETGVQHIKADSPSAAPDIAHARRNDPQTSHKAAASVSLTNLGKTKDLILAILREVGPMTDERIISHFHRRTYPEKVAADSGIRTRRAWLVDNGFIEACGTGKTASGRECQIWKATK